ncbi:MAG TPA: hypothetical protein VKR58_11820 [Aquella sp.]|nr:hypothetical protein [Aquella sp.]
MNKLLVFCLFITISSSTRAQLSKGHWLVGGDINISTVLPGEFYNPHGLTYSLMPNVGYFVIDKLVCGLRFDYSFLYPHQFHISTYGILPFVRYYLLPAEGRINFFADLSFGYSQVQYGYIRYGNYQWAASAGPTLFINRRISLSVGVGFLAFEGDSNNYGPFSQRFGMNIGCHFHLGN